MDRNLVNCERPQCAPFRLAIEAKSNLGPANRRRFFAGFTLIELLVVISIIALLIAILLPALGLARRTARQAVCISNLHQMSVALLTYANTPKEILPAPYDNKSNTGSQPDIPWQAVVFDEVTGQKLTDDQLADSKYEYLNGTGFFCPQAKLDLQTESVLSMSYAMNSDIPGIPIKDTSGVIGALDGTVFGPASYKIFRVVVSPSQTLLVADGSWCNVGYLSAGQDRGRGAIIPGFDEASELDVFERVIYNDPTRRHSKTNLNTALADGSVFSARWANPDPDIPCPPAGDDPATFEKVAKLYWFGQTNDLPDPP